MTANPTTSPKRSLDCHAVAREQIAERYVTGELSDPDREAFEEHYFHCERCFDELKTVQLIADELRRSEVELERPAVRSVSRWAVAAVAAALVVGVGLTLWVQLAPRHTAATTAAVPAKPQPPSPQQAAAARRPDAPEAAATPVAPIEQLARVEPAPYERMTLRGPLDEATSRFRHGMEKYQKRDYSGAVTDLRAAAELAPDAAHIQFFLGVSELLIGEDTAAVGHLRKSLELGDSPYLEEAHLYLAKAYLRQRNIPAAEAQLRAVTRLRGARADEAQGLLAAIGRLDKR